jgi:FkbM family methyltransferase
MKGALKELKRKWKVLRGHEGFRRAPVLSVARLVSLRARCLLGKPAILKFRRWNVQMILPPRWRGIGKVFFAFREYYEPELVYLENVLSPGKTFIDAGANFGIYSLVASRLVGQTGRVIAFEPSLQSFPVLQRNINLNNLTNVAAFRTALCEKTGTARLYHADDPVSNSLGKDSSWGGEGEEVATETLDRAIEQASVQRVDVIKLDVEGAEELVLRGARKVLTIMRPLIIFEVHPTAAARLGLSSSGASDLLKNLGYELSVLNEKVWGCGEKSPPIYFNVVAIPKAVTKAPMVSRTESADK